MEPVYLVTKVRQKLATDPRVGLTDILIHIPEAGHVVVSGFVSTGEQQAAITQALEEMPEITRVSNRTQVRQLRPTHQSEIIGKGTPGGES
jgi:osmotically-inducible protein OsmY